MKHTLKEELQVDAWANIELEWTPGHKPTAYFLNEELEELSEHQLGDWDIDELWDFFKEHNFEPIVEDAGHEEL